MTLTKEQIDFLFSFTEKKRIRYYDLQVELVDHLAAKIEEEMENNSKLSFDDALQKVYAGFGIFGFSHVVQQKEEALLARHRHMWLQGLIDHFTFPKIILIVTVFLTAYWLGSFCTPGFRFGVLILVSTIFSLQQIYIFIKDHKSMNKKIGLLQFTPFVPLLGPVLMYEQFIFFRDGINENGVFAAAFVIVFIVQAIMIGISKKMSREARQLYPEAFC